MAQEHTYQEEATGKTETRYIFSKGLPGFEQLKQYVMREHNELFSLLCSEEEANVVFITVNPFDFVPDYEFVLPAETIQDLEISTREQVDVRCIVTWHSERSKVSVNLLAPLVFNSELCRAKQIVLQNSPYTTRHTLWTSADVNAETEGGVF